MLVQKVPLAEFNVNAINSLKSKYPDFRQDSKAPTFALTYQGTWITLVNNCGFSKETAKRIEANYHELYKHSDDWVKAQLEEACKTGYVVVAFGLRVRTPAIASSILNSKSTPSHVAAEGRTAGNALGQSYGLLNNRAAIEFQQLTLASKYKLDVLPCISVHDANYFLIRNDVDVVKWVNDNLVKCVQWQELEAIKHDQVKLGGELSIYYPTWANEIHIKNGASIEEILDVTNKALNKLKEEGIL